MDFEGTILTEGMGVGRGTRFATPESNRRLDTGGRERGIEGGKGGINPGAALSIDPGLATVRARAIDPLQTKPVLTDGSGISAKAIDNVGSILSRAAFDYAERQAENEATVAALSFNDRARTAFHGDPDSTDPNASKGLFGLRGEAAVKARGIYTEAIDKDYADTIASLSPAAKQKALARLSGIRDTALNRGASHIAQEQRRYEAEIQAAALQDMGRELPLDYRNAPNLKIAMLSSFGADAASGAKAWDAAALDGAERLYRQAYTGSDPEKPSGMPQLMEYRKHVADTLSPHALNNLDSLIKSFEVTEKQSQKAAESDAKAARREALESNTVNALAAVDKDLGSVKSIYDVQRMFPAIQHDLQSVMAVHNYAEHKRKERDSGERKENRAEMLYELNELRSKGEAFNELLPFMAFAQKHGVSQGVGELYKAQREQLTVDEELIAKKYNTILKSAYSSFMYEEGTGVSIPGIQDPKLKAMVSTSTTTKLKQKPQELVTIENALLSIYNDKDLKPFEKSEKMTSYIKSEAIKAGVPQDKLDTIDPVPIIASQFLVKNYAEKLKGGDNVKAERLGVQQTGFSRVVNSLADRFGLTSNQVGEPAMMQADDGTMLPSSQIVEPPPKVEVDYHVKVFKNEGSPEVIDAFYNAAEKKGYKSVRFVSNEDATMYGAPGTKYTGYVGVNKSGKVVALQPKNR